MMFSHLETVSFEKDGRGYIFKKFYLLSILYLFRRKMPLTLFLRLFCYSQSFIGAFIRRHESPESPQLDIELQLKFPSNFQIATSLNFSSTKFYCFFLDDKDSLKLYPAVALVQKKKGSNFSIICTTERMKYHSDNFHWFKQNGVLSNTSNVVRHSTFLRLDFAGLNEQDTGIYKCNITDDTNIQEKRFQLIVFGK